MVLKQHPKKRRLGKAGAILALAAFCLISTACRRKHFPHYPADYRQYAYVANSGSNTVTALDLVNLRQDRVIAVGANPSALAVNPHRNEVYSVNSGSASVTVIDAASNRATATIPVHRQPSAIDLDGLGERAYVANAGTNNVSVIDLSTRREIAAVGVGEAPAALRVSPDGTTVVVANHAGGSASVLDTRSLRIRNVFSGCPGASDVAILPDSTQAFIACSGSHQVMALGLANAKATLADDRLDRLLSYLDVGSTPIHLALKPDGGEIFVSNLGSDTISEIATGTDDVGGAYVVGAHPASGIVSQDNATLWVSNYNADTIGAYSVDDGKLVNTVHVGDGPSAMAFSSDGFLLLVADSVSGDVAVIRTQSYASNGALRLGSLFTMLPAGNHPVAIAVKAFYAGKKA